MSTACHPAATPATPATVGLWFEFDAAGPAMLPGDGRVRHARGLVVGLDAIPSVGTILLPCLPAEVDAMATLFTDAARPGRLVSDKLRVVAAGRDPVRRRAVIAWARRRKDKCLDRLAAPCRIITVAKLTLRLMVAEVILAVARWLPPPQASVVADQRRRGPAAAWIVLSATTPVARRLPGPKILDLGGGLLPARPTVARLARDAVALVAPSRHAARMARGVIGRGSHVIPPAPLPVVVCPTDEQESRRRLADDLRGLFMGDATRPPHRHFCDFPFERVEYLVAASPARDSGLLPAYATVLRRHRRNLKLLIDGRLPRGDEDFDEVASLGLPFDVAETAGLGEAARGRLLRHATAVVVSGDDALCLPAIFCEAVAAGTPVVMGRLAAAREPLNADELAADEYFDVPGDAAGVARAILHAVDHRDAVLTRQRAILSRLSRRTWADVVTAFRIEDGGPSTAV